MSGFVHTRAGDFKLREIAPIGLRMEGRNTMSHKQFYTRTEKLKLQSPLAYAAYRLQLAWEEAANAIGNAFRNVWKAAQHQSGQPASAVATGNLKPLRLNLQHFADGNPPGEGDPDPNNNPNNQGNPPDPDDDELTLADLLKTNPKIRAEHNERVEKAVKKRLKNIDFDVDEAKEALREKKAREEAGDDDKKVVDQRVTDLQKEVDTRDAALKRLGVVAYAAENNLDHKLLNRLAADQISSLELGENMDLEAEELDDIVSGLREEFPQLFPDKTKDDQGGDNPPPPNGSHRSGSHRQINPNPPTGAGSTDTQVAETLARLKAAKRI